MFQSVQSKDNSVKKNNNSEKKAPGVDYAQMMQLQTVQSRSDLATQMKESSPAQFMVEEPSFAKASEGKEVQAKLNSYNPVQMQEEEELQAKLSNNIPAQMQEEEEEMLQTKQIGSGPMQFMVDEEEEAVQAKLNDNAPIQKQEEDEEEMLQAKLSDNAPAQFQEEEEELQAKLSNNVPAQMQEEEEELQAKLNSSNPVQMQEEPSFAKASEGKEEIQAKLSNNVPAQMKEDAANSVASASSGTTTSLPKDVNAKMENSFGTSFAGVNIHKNSEKATQLSALAYTQGNDVHFAPGQYNPSSTKGQELIGHELTHVVQQRAGRVNGTQNKGGMNVNIDKSLENEADVLGARAAAGQGVDVSGVGSGVQRKESTRIPPYCYVKTDIEQVCSDYGVTLEELKEIYFIYTGNKLDEGNVTAGMKIYLPIRCKKMQDVVYNDESIASIENKKGEVSDLNKEEKKSLFMKYLKNLPMPQKMDKNKREVIIYPSKSTTPKTGASRQKKGEDYCYAYAFEYAEIGRAPARKKKYFVKNNTRQDKTGANVWELAGAIGVNKHRRSVNPKGDIWFDIGDDIAAGKEVFGAISLSGRKHWVIITRIVVKKITTKGGTVKIKLDECDYWDPLKGHINSKTFKRFYEVDSLY